MKILNINDLQPAIDLLQQGAVIAYPTETSYALGCDATNPQAVAQVFAIKNRAGGKGTPVIIPNHHQPAQYLELSSEAQKLATKHWPGALNIIGHRQPQSPISTLCETDGTQAIRQSSNRVASQLAALLDRPLVATSANQAGEPAIYDPELIKQAFANTELAAIIDAGILPKNPASTTIDCTSTTSKLVRQGDINL